MDCEKFEEIMDSDEKKLEYEGCIEDLVDAGITEEDVAKLRDLNWMARDEYLACFV